MKCRQPVLFLSLLLLVGALPAAQAQQHQKRSDPNVFFRAPHSLTGKMIVLPIGTTFEARINKTISSCKSHPGESFSLVLSTPVLSNGIDVIIPAGSQVIGEVVEAVPSSAQVHKKHMPAPRGKLRIQIMQLRTPDGTSFPLVANLTGEEETRKGGHSGLQTPLGSSVGFVGTAESFESVAPGSNRYGKQYTSGQGRGPEKEYVHKKQFLADEIYGMGDEQHYQIEDRRIRSLVLRKADLYIDVGSPLTVRLAAPLRLSVTPPNQGAPVGGVEDMGTVEDSLPPPTPKSAGSDIPPIGAGGRQEPPAGRRGKHTSAADAVESPPPATTPPPQAQTQTPPPATPPASPSADF